MSCTSWLLLWSSLQSFLYGENTDFITYSDFINKELILFSNMDNERSIPSMVDGELEHDLSIVVTSTIMVYIGVEIFPPSHPLESPEVKFITSLMPKYVPLRLY